MRVGELLKKLDLSGQRFGSLTVIRPGEKHGKKTTWVCLCDCGNTSIVVSDNLRSGHTKSCGCLKNQYIKKYDLIGQKFGRLTVIGKDGQKQKCLCDCGKEISVITGNLIDGNTRSCGCYQKQRTSESSFVSLVGKKFGKLTVVERVENNRFRQVVYRCRCDCGGEAIVSGNNLRSGTTQSCGCIKSKGEERINNWLKSHGINFMQQYTTDSIKYRTGRRPIFDFAVFDDDGILKFLIEYNGSQHYSSGYGWNSDVSHEQIVARDREKRELCNRQGIPLYEIPYTKLTQVEQVLQSIICDEFQLGGENT